VTVTRDGHEKTIDVTIEKLKTQEASAEDKGGEGPIGLALAPLSPDSREQLGLDDSVQGVVVAKVAPDSRAADSGVQAGDVIEKIGNNSVKTPQEAVKLIKTAEKEKKEAVPLLVMRNGTTYYLALQLVES
jgi:serine protease Do